MAWPDPYLPGSLIGSINKSRRVLSEGQEVDAEIIAVDEEKKKISLSIRTLLAPAAEEDAPVDAE